MKIKPGIIICILAVLTIASGAGAVQDAVPTAADSCCPPAVSAPAASLLRVAVLDFENKVPVSVNDMGSGMAEMLISALKQSGQYAVLERAALAEILGEQDFTNSGRVQRGQQLAVGRVRGAQLLIKGAVTEFSYNVSNRNLGFGFGGVGVGLNQARARVAIDVRLIDPQTGEIVNVFDQAAEISATGGSVAGTLQGFSFSGGGSENHPMGQAVRQLIENTVADITRQLDTNTLSVLLTQRFAGQVVKMDGLERIVINRGSSDGVRVGDRFHVGRVMEELTDPETGEVLSREKLVVGEIEVTSVQDRWSEAKALSGDNFVRGDIVSR